MRTRLSGGKVVDPANGASVVRDVVMEHGRLVSGVNRQPEEMVIDCTGCVVMAGGIDLHTHVAGGNLALARLLLPELHVSEDPHGALAFDHARWSAMETGRLYAAMGYTTVVEPALAPAEALEAHLELADIPGLDRLALAAAGNDDFLLSLLRDRESPAAVAEALALTLSAAKAFGVKVVAAGGPAAFHAGLRRFGLDDEVPHYGLSSRAILSALIDAAAATGSPHPLHVHANNLGLPGGPATISETLAVADDRPVHFAHLQFYAYESDARGRLISGAEAMIRALESAPRASFDLGQVVFGPTATLSLDLQKQWSAATAPRALKAALVDGDAEGGGVVPVTYAPTSPVNALQWAIGLELALLAPDPWRLALTTDHPNGGPFTSYPQIIHWLMNRDSRAAVLETLPPAARKRSALAGLSREYTLEEIAIITRAAPARILGLSDRGHLAEGGRADVAVYRDCADRKAMFGSALHVFKDGRPTVRNGQSTGLSTGRTLYLSCEADRTMRRRVDSYLDDRFGQGLAAFAVGEGSFGGRDVLEAAAWRR